MNQRIQPVNFDWGHLELKKRTNLLYNYRNSKKILEFAEQFIERAKEINKQEGNSYAQIPSCADPEYAVEGGEQIRIIEYKLQEEAQHFLKQFRK
ncbi:hypothetical protein [Stanieria cyanosphaera]|uniref:hypothetical protein n=1 Tax=Stanieria cyanosphaera TaxID=102116 RepID=UPI00031399F8|nr:hypothetical protein [Stanieria cyanosphaera]